MPFLSNHEGFLEAAAGPLRSGGKLPLPALARDEYVPGTAAAQAVERSGSQALVPGLPRSLSGPLSSPPSRSLSSPQPSPQPGPLSHSLQNLLPHLLPSLLKDASRKECAHLDCRHGRSLSWRSRRLLVFEDKLACRGACVVAMLRAAIAREGTAGPASRSVAPHRHRVPLGLVLLAQGWITHPQLQRALEGQRARGGRIGDWLVAECGLDAERVTRGLSVQWNCPVLRTEGFSPQAMALVLPRMFLREFGMVPLRVAGGRILYLGFRDRLDASLAFAVERMSGLRVETGVVAEEPFEAARGRLLECSFPATYGKAVADTDALAAQMAAVLEQRQAAASRLVRLHQYYWLRLWTEAGSKAVVGSAGARREDVSDFLFRIGAEA
jgi:hypothetical protein